MGDNKFRITLPCVSPEGEERLHSIVIDNRGIVSTPDHDSEEWPRSLGIMRALGGDGDTSPCAWWKHLNNPALADALGWGECEWRDGQLLVTFGDQSNFEVESLDISGWRMEPGQEWNLAVRRTVERGLGLHPPADSEDRQEWELNAASPYDILAFLQHEPTNQSVDGNIPSITVLRTLDMLRAGGAENSIDAWAATGQPWLSWMAWDANGYSASQTGEFCAAYARAARTLESLFPKDILVSMVFHSPGTLAVDLDRAGVERKRALALMAYAPQVIFPDWPGLAESTMPEIPSNTPRSWVAEALLCIPSAGFLPGLDRTAWSKTLAADLPRRLAEDGDPSGWDPRWCWPPGTFPGAGNRWGDA